MFNVFIVIYIMTVYNIAGFVVFELFLDQGKIFMKILCTLDKLAWLTWLLLEIYQKKDFLQMGHTLVNFYNQSSMSLGDKLVELFMKFIWRLLVDP